MCCTWLNWSRICSKKNERKFNCKLRQENMKKYETYFSGIDDKLLSFAIGFGNAFIFVLPIWLVVFLNREQNIKNREKWSARSIRL